MLAVSQTTGGWIQMPIAAMQQLIGGELERPARHQEAHFRERRAIHRSDWFNSAAIVLQEAPSAKRWNISRTIAACFTISRNASPMIPDRPACSL
jgi:hypothetical protein